MALNYAEKHGPYIFHALKNLSGSDGLHTFDYDDETSMPNEAGIYMFYILSSKTGKKYPVYVGKTEVDFRARIAGHKKDGVIEGYNTNRFPRFPQNEEREQDLHLQVVFVRLPTSFIIKLAESLFLCAFDFALNKMENGDKRYMIEDTHQIENFNTSYENMMGAINKINEDVLKLRKAFI